MRGILPNHTNFKCYVYASHASNVDTRKSITGYIRFMFSEDPASWQRRIQTSVALSIGIHGCMCRDTTSSIAWAKWVCVSKFHTNDHGSSRRSSHTKHGDTRKEFARDAFNKGTIELGFVPTAEHTTGWWLTKSSTIPYLLSY
jgi:hypothetical protein